MNNDWNEGSSFLKLGKKDYPDYEDMVEEIVQTRQMKPSVLLAKKGDVIKYHEISERPSLMH